MRKEYIHQTGLATLKCIHCSLRGVHIGYMIRATLDIQGSFVATTVPRNIRDDDLTL